LRSQLHAYDEDIRTQTKLQKQLQEQIQLLQSRIQMTPLVEQQYKEMTRDHQTAQDFYNETAQESE